ncbi:MAG: YezD family protein [Nitrosospira sp.]
MATITGIGLEEKIPDIDGKRIPVDIKQQILRAIAHIEYGSVEVVIHDGKVVQIECRKKIRVDRNACSRRSVVP